MTEAVYYQITPRQCTAARVLLGWTQAQLADASRTSIRAVSNFETERRTPRRATIDAIEAAFVVAGLKILESGGVDFDEQVS